MIAYRPNMYQIINQDVFDIFRIFNHYSWDSCRLVGGCIRNSLLNVPISDYDFATIFSPNDVMDICQERSIKYKEVGLSHGTVMLLYRGKSYEMTSLRRDRMCDGRHASVEFLRNWEEDSCRRDFRINSLYLSYDGAIHDYQGGLCDVNPLRFAFIGDARKRILEDYLRILRFFRFSAQYDGIIEEDFLAICAEHASLLPLLSKERIRSEFFILTKARYAHKTLVLMQKKGILQYIHPCFRVTSSYNRLILLNSYGLDYVDDMHTMISLLPRDFFVQLSIRDDILPYFTLKREERIRMRNIQKVYCDYDFFSSKKVLCSQILMEIYYLYSLRTSIDFVLFIYYFSEDNRCNANDCIDAISSLEGHQYHNIPVGFDDLIEAGYGPGYVLRDKMKEALTIWINSGRLLDKNSILRIMGEG